MGRRRTNVYVCTDHLIDTESCVKRRPRTEQNNTAHGAVDVRRGQGEELAEIGNDIGRKDKEYREIDTGHGKEDDVMAKFNDGRDI